MTTCIVRKLDENTYELSSDTLIVGGTKGIEYSDNKIITWKFGDRTFYILYAGKYIDKVLHQDLKSVFDWYQFIKDYDPTMEVIYINKGSGEIEMFYINNEMIKDFDHSFAIGSGGIIANTLMRYDSDIATEDIYREVASADIFTGERYIGFHISTLDLPF